MAEIKEIIIGLGINSITKDIFENKNRKNIILLVAKKPLKISEIKKQLGLNYKTVWEHVKILEKYKIVSLTQQEKEPGKPVYVSLPDREIIEYLDKSSEEIMVEIRKERHTIPEWEKIYSKKEKKIQ